MIKLVISGGDSFTYGAELPDDYHGPAKGSWAQLIANKLNAKHINKAMSGRSNSFIVRHIINAIHEASQHNYYPQEIFVQVMWTFAGRTEIPINFNTERDDSPWFPIDPYVCEDESKSKWFKEVSKDTPNYEETRNNLRNRYKINKKLGLVDFTKEYYKVTQGVYDTYSSLKEILMLQDFLDKRNVKYMFTYVNEHVMIALCDHVDNYGHNYDHGLVSIDKFTNGLRNFIKFDEWYKFPGNKEFMGFDDWAKANGYPYATSHPLEQAHKDAAELLYEKARQTLTGSVGALSGE